MPEPKMVVKRLARMRVVDRRYQVLRPRQLELLDLIGHHAFSFLKANVPRVRTVCFLMLRRPKLDKVSNRQVMPNVVGHLLLSEVNAVTANPGT
jgi:hypothetical protein